MGIDLDLATFGQFQTDLLGTEAIGVRDAANRDDQAVGIDFLFAAVLVGIVDRDAFLRDLDVANLDAGDDLQALLGKYPGGFLGDLKVGHRKKIW